MNKKPVFAGSFYPEKPEEITNLLNSYKHELTDDYKSKAIIVPHAGVYYSGHAAMIAFQHLELNDTIFIIAPAHQLEFNNIALPEYTFFDTPLGSIEVNNKLIQDIVEKFPAIISNEPFEKEHSIEVQLPFLQNIFTPPIQSAIDFVKGLKNIGRKFKIVPILVGNCDYRLISDLISSYWGNSSFVISSDLSHFYTQQECRQIDAYTATIIETGKLDFFQPMQACGLTGIMGLVDFANNNECSLIRAMMYNSGDISHDTSKVVGYGSWFLYTDNKNEFIERYYSKYIMNIVKATILTSLRGEDFIPRDIPQALTQYGASFVTLKMHNDTLRGCIGSVYPTKPLILDLIDNAKNAAFQDPRFEPLTEKELHDLKISISILSSIQRINFKDERDLLSKIHPHGVIIVEKNKRAVYLPEVWEQLPEKDVFLNSLKEKAGLPPEYFSRTIEAYKFDTVSITD